MMAADSTQISESTKNCMAKIDKIIENALGNESSGTGSRMASNIHMETKGMGDFSPSASPVRKPSVDVSKIVFSPTRDNYHSTKSSSMLSGIANNETPMKRFESESRPSTKDSFMSNTTKESRYTSVSDISDNWVNYQFERLVREKKNNPKSKTTELEFSSSVPHVAKVKNVEEILREYSSNDSFQPKNYHPGPQSFGMSSARNSNLYKAGLMNISHNNETLNSINPEVEQMRRVGSSVDGDVGDVLKSFGAKCSLSGTRCSSSQMLDAEENKSLGMPRDSEVDFKPPPNSSGRIELSEIRTDLSDLNYSFQKERERLRHLETLIRKTPASSSSGPEVIHTLKSHNYSSRFLNEYTGRKAFSLTDYSKFGGSDWRSSPPTDYIGRASSAMSYKNLGVYSPTSRTNYMSDYNPSQYTSSGFDSARVPSMTTQRHESHEHETEPISQPTYNYNNYPKPSGSVSLNKTKLNRSYNAKKDRNMSKSLTETHATRRKSSFIKSFNMKKTSPSESRRYFDNRDSKPERQWSSSKAENKSRNKYVSPNSTSISEILRGDPKKDTRSKCKFGKYQPYQPCVTQHDKFLPKRTKSEVSTMNTLCTNQFSGPQGSDQSDGECDPQRNYWSTSLFSSDAVPCPEAEPINDMAEKINEASKHMRQQTNKNKKGKRNLRSKSECRVPNSNVSIWSMHNPDHFVSANKILQSQGSSGGKTHGRKLKPKVKKGTSSVVKQKKIITKQK